MKRKNQGFTLLEIIIVIIIVGVLASLALPRLFATVEFSRATEALSGVQTVRGGMERCYLQNSNYLACDLTALDIEDPTLSANSHFTYTVANRGAVSGFTVVAQRNSRDGVAGGDFIYLFVDMTGGIIQKSGTGAFKGIK